LKSELDSSRSLIQGEFKQFDEKYMINSEIFKILVRNEERKDTVNIFERIARSILNLRAYILLLMKTPDRKTAYEF